MDRGIHAGISGFFLAIIMNLFTSGLLYFIPSFLSAILIVYVYRLETLKESLVAAFMTYTFNDGILGTIVLATCYLESRPYEVSVNIWLVLYPLANALTAIIAGYVGIWLVQKMKPSRELPHPPLPPPIQPV
jgi:hypothetical protein